MDFRGVVGEREREKNKMKDERVTLQRLTRLTRNDQYTHPDQLDRNHDN